MYKIGDDNGNPCCIRGCKAKPNAEVYYTIRHFYTQWSCDQNHVIAPYLISIGQISFW